jgi:hypothetical protein
VRKRWNWAERFDARVRVWQPVVLVFLAAALIGAFFELARGGDEVRRWAVHRWWWRSAEYRKLENLEAGMSLENFKASLGAPVFVRPSRYGRLIESSFRGRGYWVQTISDRTETVDLYAVTSCSDDFNPSFNFLNTSITLRRSVLAAPTSGPDAIGGFGVRAVYWTSGATANSHIFDMTYGGNPGNYKSYAWGLNDACPDWFDRFDSVPPLDYQGAATTDDSRLQAFRRHAVVNTYAETAVQVDLKRMLASFQIGVDRLQTRTLEHPKPQPYPVPKAHFLFGPHHYGAEETFSCLSSQIGMKYTQPEPSFFDWSILSIEDAFVVERGDSLSYAAAPRLHAPRHAEVAFMFDEDSAVRFVRTVRRRGLVTWRRRNAVIVMAPVSDAERFDARRRTLGSASAVRRQQVQEIAACLSPALK